jgi:hypothetical protein
MAITVCDKVPHVVMDARAQPRTWVMDAWAQPRTWATRCR